MIRVHLGIRWALTPVTGVPVKDKKEKIHRECTEGRKSYEDKGTRMMLLQGKEHRIAHRHQKLEEATGWILPHLPHSLQKEPALLTRLFQTSVLQNCERINLCYS